MIPDLFRSHLWVPKIGDQTAMSTFPKVSVVISTYNRDWCLGAAIESVLNQTSEDFELVILDDGSTDQTAKVVRKYQRDGRVRAFFEDHQGASRARNRGIEKTRGQYVAFLDSDDLWFPDKLQRQVAFLDEHPEFAFVHGSVEMMDVQGHLLPDETKKINRLYKKAQVRGKDYVGLAEAALIFSSAVLFRKECLDRSGYLDPTLYSLQDLDLYLRITFQGDQIGFLEGPPVAKYGYRGRDGHLNPEHSHSYLRVFQKQIELLEKTNQVSVHKKAYLHFLIHTANFYYALNELEKSREFSFQAVRVDPKSLCRFCILRNIFASFISVRALRFLRDFKSIFLWKGKSI